MSQRPPSRPEESFSSSRRAGGEPAAPISRRRFLIAGTASAAGVIALGPDLARAGAAGSSQTVLGHTLVRVASNRSFRFEASLANQSGSGESSPITHPYWIATTLVTNTQYRRFVRHAGRKNAPAYWSGESYPTGRSQHPVLFVSGAQADAYCAWLNTQTRGWRFRLPTEAEWENAARGPHDLGFPWGQAADQTYKAGRLSTRFNDNAVCATSYLAHHGTETATYLTGSALAGQSAAIEKIISISENAQVQGWIDENNETGFVFTNVFQAMSNAGGFTTPVAQYPRGANAYGCLDMAGNAWEWTQSTITAQNGGEQGQRVTAIRGGSWYAQTESCSTSYRGEGRAPDGAYNSVGFRVFAQPR